VPHFHHELIYEVSFSILSCHNASSLASSTFHFHHELIYEVSFSFLSYHNASSLASSTHAILISGHGYVV
jgi:hypothetical protein